MSLAGQNWGTNSLVPTHSVPVPHSSELQEWCQKRGACFVNSAGMGVGLHRSNARWGEVWMEQEIRVQGNRETYAP